MEERYERKKDGYDDLQISDETGHNEPNKQGILSASAEHTEQYAEFSAFPRQVRR